MKRIRILGLMVFAVFALSAVAASTASAVQWLDNGNPISSPIEVLSKGTLLLEDLASPGGGTAVLCEGKNRGTVGAGSRDLTLSITNIVCSFERVGACKAGTTPTAEAVHLPWVTRLLTVAGVTRDMIENSGAGAPGWAVECESILGKQRDECTSETEGDPSITNNSSGDVTETFDPSERASCTKGNSTSGMVIGNVLIFAEKAGLKISTG